ncbi:MAG: alpha/beta hydrolase-fold protein, partial [Corynebacterium variabile]
NDRDGLDDGGSYSRFENGAIYSTSRTGAHVMYKGPVYDAWKKEGYEHPWGIGYPVEDDVADPKAQRVVSFERGTVHVPADGSPTVTRTPVEEPAPDPDEGQDPAEGQAPEAPAVPASEEQIPAPAQ